MKEVGAFGPLGCIKCCKASAGNFESLLASPTVKAGRTTADACGVPALSVLVLGDTIGGAHRTRQLESVYVPWRADKR